MLHLSSNSNRTKNAQKHIIYMFLIKGCNIVINLAYVPLLITSLDTERYGIWLTITTIVSWIAFFDLGLGNGLRNKLAESVAKNDTENAKKYVSTTYGTMGVLCSIFILLVFFIIPFCNWNNILNTQSIPGDELSLLVLWVFSSLGFQMFLKLINSVLYALQKPALSSLLLMLSQLVAFFGVLVYSLIRTNSSLLELGIIISIAPVLVLFISSILLFNGNIYIYRPRIRYFDKSKIKTIVLLGGKFFWIQLTTLLLFQSNNIIIAHTCGSESVAEYNIAYKYIGLIEMAFTIIVTPFWSAATEAYTKKDNIWIKAILNKLSKIALAFVGLGIVLIILSDFTYKWWLSDAIIPDKILLSLLLIYFSIQLSWIRYGSIINGIGFVKLQFYITLTEALIHIPLAILLGNLYGLKGVICSLIMATIANIIWPKIQIRNIFSNKQGIWMK